jgi:hypothetical protein
MQQPVSPLETLPADQMLLVIPFHVSQARMNLVMN